MGWRTSLGDLTRPRGNDDLEDFLARSTAMVTLLITDSFRAGRSIDLDYQDSFPPHGGVHSIACKGCGFV